jgi:hypothetical protein
MATLAALAFAFNIALAEATDYRLEAPLQALLDLTALATLLFAPIEANRGTKTGRVWIAVLGLEWVLLALVRPEGVLLGALLAAWFARITAADHPWRTRLAPGVLFAFGLAIYLVWHRFAFGALAPNTFYAKASDSRWMELRDGVHYVVDYARGDLSHALVLAPVLLAPLAALAPGLWASPAARLRFTLASSVAALALAEVIVEGGDSYTGARFLAAPIALFLAAVSIAAQGLRGRLAAIPALFVVALLGLEAPRGLSHLDVRASRIAHWQDDGRDFHCEVALAGALASRVSSVAETDFQRLKYFQDGLEVIDLSGLSDRRIAHTPSPGHNRWGKDGLLFAPGSDADVLILGPRWLHPAPLADTTTRALVDDPRTSRLFVGRAFPKGARDALVAHYLPATLANPCGGWMNFFVRADRASLFEGSTSLGDSPPSRARIGRAE